MPRVRNVINEIQILCWETDTEDQIEKKVQDYLKEYPHLHNPACIDLLNECVKTWFRIREIEKMLEVCETEKVKLQLLTKLEKTTDTWMRMLGNLGISFTRQQYKAVKPTKVQPPYDRLKMLKGDKRE